ncbi:MAG: PAS domain-containing protein [Leptolyngbyaceae cyanobacterium CSU_1_4]|nr:PAS domain-containing protein [Leptolyngbyaceae cyanobacterium CSU_1_4]
MHKPVIICVDDEPLPLESLRIVLKEVVGHHCLIETAASGQEALDLMERLQKTGDEVVLVLADYLMPGLKGDELLKQIHLRSPKTLTILLSGQADLGGVSNAIRDAKLYRYISKPWQLQDLSLIVSEAIASYEKDQQLEAQRFRLQSVNQELAQLVHKLEQAKEAQQQSEAKLKDVVNSAIASITSFRVSDVGTWDYDYRSAGCERVFGYTPQELLDDKDLWQSRIHPDDLERIIFPTYYKISQGITPITIEYRFLRKDGSLCWISSAITSRRDKAASDWIVTSVETDISDRKVVEAALTELYQQIQRLNANLEQQVEERTAQLQQKMQELEELSQLKDNFLHAVSHDLRTPLMGSLLVLKDLLSHSGDSVAISRTVITRMIEGSDRQLRLLNTLLDAHYNEIQGMELHLEPIPLNTLITQIILDLTPLITASQATVTCLVAPTFPVFSADPVQIRRVFENLITNALNHNLRGITITVQAILEGTTIRCSVQDNGEGIEAEDCHFLFERYTRRNARSPGIGLGLYLCRQIISAHGGEIGVISAPGEGSTFWFTLPYTDPSDLAPRSSKINS